VLGKEIWEALRCGQGCKDPDRIQSRRRPGVPPYRIRKPPFGARGFQRRYKGCRRDGSEQTVTAFYESSLSRLPRGRPSARPSRLPAPRILPSDDLFVFKSLQGTRRRKRRKADSFRRAWRRVHLREPVLDDTIFKFRLRRRRIRNASADSPYKDRPDGRQPWRGHAGEGYRTEVIGPSRQTSGDGRAVKGY